MKLENLFKFDYDLSNRLRVAEKPGLLRKFGIIFGHSGDSWTDLILLGFLLYFGSEYWKFRAIVLTIAILVTAAFVMTLKFTIRRSRPEGEWGQLYRKTDPHSFPSGHAARAFMLGVIAVGLGPAWFGISLMIWGPLVGLARVAMGLHYVSDILAGWIVGAFMGILTVQLAMLFV